MSAVVLELQLMRAKQHHFPPLWAWLLVSRPISAVALEFQPMRAKQHYSLTRGLGKPTNQRIAANVSDQSELGIAANQSKAALYSHPQSDQSEQLHWNRSQ